MNTMRILAAMCLVAAACASGGAPNGPNGDDMPADANHPHDAAVTHDTSHPIDSSPPIDARPIDAAPPQDSIITLPDGNGGLFCTQTSDCGPSQCCLMVDPADGINFCIDGTDVFGLCIPSSN